MRRCAVAALAAGACLALAACSGSSTTDNKSGGVQSGAAKSGDVKSGDVRGSAIAVPPDSSGPPPSVNPSGSAPGSISEAPNGNTGDLSSIVVQRGDVPRDWRAEEASRDDDAGQKDALRTCVGVPPTSADRADIVPSQDFGTETASVSSTATRFMSQSSVDSDATIFRSPKVESCFRALLRKQLTTGSGQADVLSSSVSVSAGSRGGPSNVVGVATGRFVLAGNGDKVTLYVTAVFITGPQLEVEVSLAGYGKPFDGALQQNLVAAVAQRARNA